MTNHAAWCDDDDEDDDDDDNDDIVCATVAPKTIKTAKPASDFVNASRKSLTNKNGVMDIADSLLQSPSTTTSDENCHNIILSLHDEYYKKTMWEHFRVLGWERDSNTEKRIGEIVFDIFKEKLSSPYSSISTGNVTRMGQRRGKFYKQHRLGSKLEEVDDRMALESKCVNPIHD